MEPGGSLLGAVEFVGQIVYYERVVGCSKWQEGTYQVREIMEGYRGSAVLYVEENNRDGFLERYCGGRKGLEFSHGGA